MPASSKTIITLKYRIGFVIRHILCVLAGSATAMIIFYLYTRREIGASHYYALLTLQGLRQDIVPAIVLTVGIVIITTTILALLITLFTTHRIAGPVYRMERIFEAMGKGRFDMKVRFRKHDEVGKLANDLNAAIDSLNTRISYVRMLMAEVREEAERVKKDPSLSHAILAEKVRLLKDAAFQFKTE